MKIVTVVVEARAIFRKTFVMTDREATEFVEQEDEILFSKMDYSNIYKIDNEEISDVFIRPYSE